MKSFRYINIPFSDQERTAFIDNVKPFQGSPIRWYAFNDSGVLAECETRVVILSWDEVRDVITMGTLHELKMVDHLAFESFNSFI